MSRLPAVTNRASLAHAASAAALLLAATLAVPAGSAQADDLIVRYDQAQLLRLPRHIAEVIVGNPSIADVAVQGGNILVVTGKTYGITNVIALDAERNIIQDQRIVVEADNRIVSLHKGAERQTYSCTPVCQSHLTVGDSAVF